MTNDTNPEQELEEQIDEETEESSTDSEESETSDAPSEDAELKAAKAEAAKFRRLFEKAQKKPTTPPTGGVTREEVQELLLAKEYDEEEISEIKDLARGKGISYLQAIESPLFKSWKEARDAEKRRNDASLGSSKGASFSKSKEVPTDREAHKEYFRKAMGN